MWIDDDITFCANKDQCLRKDECSRARQVVGVHSYALFYKEGEDCQYFYKMENYNDKHISDNNNIN